MRIVRLCGPLPDDLGGRAVAIGNFDGVHLGHRRLLEAAAEAGGEAGSAVLTFEPPPVQVLRPDRPPRRLTALRGKARKLRAAGVGVLCVQRFSRAFAARSAEEFVRGTLVERLGARHVVVGSDFRFGAGRGGDVQVLAESDLFGLTVVDPVADAGGEAYASTAIRALVEAGDARAPPALGGPWEVEGRVQRGERRGNTLGFPTANLSYGVQLPPADGVYSGWAGIVDGSRTEWRMAAVSTGVRPHFSGEGRVLEAHLLDFSGDLYGRLLRVAFVSRLRPERKFASANALIQAIAGDVRKVRTELAGAEPPAEDS